MAFSFVSVTEYIFLNYENPTKKVKDDVI